MKTLILLLAAGLSAPALAQSNYDTSTSTTTERSTTNYGSPATNPSSSTWDSTRSSDSSVDRSTGSSSLDESSSDVNNSANSAFPDRSTGTSSEPSATAPATDTGMAAPATASSEQTTSRTYREDMGRERKAGGLYIEPAILGTREDADIKSNLVGADNTGTSNGFGADLKLGGHIGEMFFLAADGRYERTRFADSSYSNQDANVWNWGPVVGIQAPWAGMRVWGTYVLDGNYDPNAGANGTDLKFKDPYGWRGGIGVRLASVSLNLEYEDLTYRTTEIQSLGNVAVGTNTNVDFAQRGYALSLSFPMEL